jgi:hypothetical protein
MFRISFSQPLIESLLRFLLYRLHLPTVPSHLPLPLVLLLLECSLHLGDRQVSLPLYDPQRSLGLSNFLPLFPLELLQMAL